MDPPQANRRNFFRFGLRSLLLLSTLSGLIMAGVAMRAKRIRQRQKALEVVWNRGGNLEWAPAIRRSWLRRMLGEPLRSVRRVALNHTQVTDSDLAFLSAFRSLESLQLQEAAKLTDKGLRHVMALKSLRELDLSRTGITDNGIELLTSLDELQILNLDGTRITDRAMKRLSELSSLEILSVEATRISDDGLAELRRRTPLRKLVLDGTDVTLGGLHRMRTAWPRTTISWRPGPGRGFMIMRDDDSLLP